MSNRCYWKDTAGGRGTFTGEHVTDDDDDNDDNSDVSVKIKM